MQEVAQTASGYKHLSFIAWKLNQKYLFLSSPIVLKMKIKEVKKEKGDRKLIAAQKKKKVLKQGVLRKKDLKKLTLYIKNGANCPCSQLDSLGSNFLIMGRKVDQQLLLMSIHKWDKKSKELKFAIKYMKSHQCPTYHTVFQWHSMLCWSQAPQSLPTFYPLPHKVELQSCVSELQSRSKYVTISLHILTRGRRVVKLLYSQTMNHGRQQAHLLSWIREIEMGEGEKL